MNDGPIYGPDGPDGGVFEGVFEFDCSEFISPELRAQLRIGKWEPLHLPPDGLVGDAGPAVGDTAPDAPPPAGG